MKTARRTAACCSWIMFATLWSCSGSGGGETGAVQVSVTDAATDEIDRFEIDLVSIRLVKADGAVAHALPLTTRVDFAQVVGLAEVLNAASVPVGTYLEAEVTLDFSTAVVHLTGADSDATVLDGSGSPLLGPVTVALQLPALHPLVVAPGVTRVFTLDFDLNASTAVDVPGNIVQISPIIVADVDDSRPRAHRIRGPLESVDPVDSSFVLAVRPFRAIVTDFGAVRVTTDAETFFEINGESFQGSDGIAEMTILSGFTAVVATGEFDAENTFLADEVLVGSSVAGGTMDVAHGHVVARSGDTLTLRGARLDRAGGVVTFNEDVTVHLEPAETRVVQQFSLAPLATDAISVGQRIVVFGSLDPGAGTPTFTSSEWVRLVRTAITGTVNSLSTGLVEMNAARIGVRPVSDFDFAGTGSTIDSDPLTYEVDTGALDLSGITAGSRVRAIGHVVPFGSAQPDFEAQSVTDLSDTALMGVVWSSDSVTQFAGLSDTRIDLDLTDAPLVHHVDLGGTAIDLSGLPTPAVLPAGALGLHVIFDQGTVALYADFGNFVTNLEAELTSGRTAQRLAALGGFDDTTGELSASVVVVILNP